MRSNSFEFEHSVFQCANLHTITLHQTFWVDPLRVKTENSNFTWKKNEQSPLFSQPFSAYRAQFKNRDKKGWKWCKTCFRLKQLLGNEIIDLPRNKILRKLIRADEYVTVFDEPLSDNDRILDIFRDKISRIGNFSKFFEHFYVIETD